MSWVFGGLAALASGMFVVAMVKLFRLERDMARERPTDFDLMQVTANHQSARMRLLRENQDLQIAIANLMKEREELFRELRRRAN